MNDTTPSSFRPDLLAGQVAFVTGGATGIGKEICRVLGRHGARIAMLSRREEKLKAAVEELQREGIEAHYAVGDVREPQAVETAVRDILARFGRIDILVNNAAGNFPAPMSQISPNGFRSVVAIDLLGTYNVSRAVFDAWQREHGGNIVNISAPFELKGAALQAHVAAAKAGVDSLTRTCAVEWGPYGIRVNAVAPGQIEHTEGMQRFAAVVEDSGPGSPLGIAGHGSDIAHAVLFFCSPAARFISGQVIAVDGAATVDQLKLGLGRI
ncbi:MAG: SDR family oxidoreductase [Gammaproteobacteria bacterium]|jgi:peroxisomal 2,4-dienoyl-CoA reductase|nr:SDR family oxidoreductase [Gammaproteobacteria bacterium]MBP6479942.1 SDR family oxidoreductase [Pseudomonadales bacterium]MBP7909127.1 SDR family oxidoreductase [Pseudomonadales bacterium]